MSEPLTILAVDDEPVNLRLLDAVLVPGGHRVVHAASGAECLDVLAHEAVSSAIVGPRSSGQLEGLITHVEGDGPALPGPQLELLRTKLRSD